jgi:septum formation protein
VSITVILASRSPRRIELLGQLGVALEIVPADIDETPHANESPVKYVERLAREKARVVAASHTGIVLGADTTIDIDNEILGQPVDEQDAAYMLRRLSGRTHRVHTGVAVSTNGNVCSLVTTTLVSFVPITDELLSWYLHTMEWQGKAGSYAIQGLGSSLVERIQGSYSNVVGLPLRETAQLLGIEAPNEG